MSDVCTFSEISIKDQIIDIVKKINPYDTLEADHQNDTLSWLNTTDQMCRIKKPDVPNKHLVSYFVLLDPDFYKILLVDHKNALLWLPSGGHVEPGEHPRTTAERECLEELKISANFIFKEPIFITSTKTTGITAGHTDVSLWYLLRGSHLEKYDYDKSEFNGIKWFDFKELPFTKSDPHLQRFVSKLQLILKTLVL